MTEPTPIPEEHKQTLDELTQVAVQHLGVQGIIDTASRALGANVFHPKILALVAWLQAEGERQKAAAEAANQEVEADQA